MILETDKFKITVASILEIVGILLVTIVIAKVTRFILRRSTKRKKIDEASAHSIYMIAKYFLWLITIVLILEASGMKISIILASAAALLVGVGLGLQPLFNDLASGIVLLIEQNVKIHDVIEIEADREITVGVVVHTGLRTSKVRTRDNVIIDVPNSLLVNNKVINWSQIDKVTRFEVNIGVAYGSDPKTVKKVLLECADEHRDIVKSPIPIIRFEDFGNSSLDFKLIFWTKNSFMVEFTKSDLRFNIHDKLKENGIRIPFPQRDIHIIPREG